MPGILNTEAAIPPNAPPWVQREQLTDLRRARILRYGLGVTATAAIAFGFQWPLFHVAPLFAAIFLALPQPGPTIVQAVGLFIAILLSFLLGLVFALFLLPYPLVYVLLLGLYLFVIYYGINRGAPKILATMSLLAVIILPMLALNHNTLASGVMFYFVVSAGLAVFAYLVAHVIVPDPDILVETTPPEPTHSGDLPPAAVAALKSTIGMLPIAILFLTMNWLGELLVLIFAAIFSLIPQASSSGAEGLKSLISNLIGGAAAVVFYWLIVAVPQYHFFIVLMFLATLVFGNAIFSFHPWTRYIPSSATALLVLVGGSMAEGADFMGALLGRIILISLAALYMVAVSTLLDWLFARSERGRAQGQ